MLKIKKHKGLTLSACSVTFSALDSWSFRHSLKVRAVPTPGKNARIVKLKFDKVKSEGGPGVAAWQGYEIPDIEVS